MHELNARRPRHCCGNMPKSSLANATVCELQAVTTCFSMATSMAVAVLWVSITLLTLTAHHTIAAAFILHISRRTDIACAASMHELNAHRPRHCCGNTHELSRSLWATTGHYMLLHGCQHGCGRAVGQYHFADPHCGPWQPCSVALTSHAQRQCTSSMHAAHGIAVATRMSSLAVCGLSPVTTCFSMATSMAEAVLRVSILLLTLTVHRGGHIQSQ